MNSINTNRMALSTATALSSHYSRMAASVGRLSSGLRVRSSGDDAAGLAIRELMRTDIAATAQGIRNANDAISLVQVADGALGIIDEKLIRMKELAEQAATGTYNSDQRLVIDSEFKAMAAEIDRIAAATDFNGIRLLDGSLSGAHDGSGLAAAGRMKIHFGPGNDSAEDYYYLESMNCSTKGLGLRGPASQTIFSYEQLVPNASAVITPLPFNTLAEGYANKQTGYCLNRINATIDNTALSNPDATIMDSLYDPIYQDKWWAVSGASYFRIPKGTKNIIITMSSRAPLETDGEDVQEQNLVLYETATGQQLTGPVSGDYRNAHTVEMITGKPYSNSSLYIGPAERAADDLESLELGLLEYHDMMIYYSGPAYTEITPPVNGVAVPNNPGYEILIIDEAKEDLILGIDGSSNSRAHVKAIWGGPDLKEPAGDVQKGEFTAGIIDIKTQAAAQKALERIDGAIVAKDKVRAHLGAMQNRLENTVTHLSIQRENLQAAESQISDVDISAEMTNFVRSQIKAQAGIAMLSQANSLPRMALSLLNS